MEIRQLKQAVAVADTGSILAASEQLFISRPAISKSISKLERELGASLFCRHASGVTLTADGERLLPKIRAAVEAFEAVEQEAAHTGNQRPIRLGCTYGVSQLLENALRAFSARSENPAVQSGFVTFEDIPRLLKTGEMDLCCCGAAFEDPALSRMTVAKERVFWGVPERSAIAKRGYITQEETYTLTRLGPRDGDQSLFLSAGGECAKGEQIYANSAYIDSDDMMYLCGCVKQGIGILGMPAFLTASFAMEGVTFVPEKPPGLLWVVSCYYLESRLTPPVRRLIREFAKGQGYNGA